MRTWTDHWTRYLEHLRALTPERRRELRWSAADWLFALGTLPLSAQFQLQSMDGWGMAGAAVGALFEAHSAPYGPVWPGLLYYALPTLCASAAMLFRRTRPVWLMALALVLLVGFGNVIPALVAVYSHAAHARGPRSPVLWGTAYIAAVGHLYWGESGEFVFMTVGAVLSLLLLGLYVGTRRQLIDELTERAARLEREQHLLAEQAVGAERNRIAREMHDVVAHRVSLIVLHAGGLEVSITDPKAAEAAGLIRGAGRQALGELRDILGVLRDRSPDAPPPSRPDPALEQVPELIAEWREAGMHIDFQSEVPDGDRLPLVVRRTAFHVVKEGVTNAAKHAPGAPVGVVLRHEDGVLRAEVTNGAAPGEVVPPPESGFGLSGLRERMAAAGGELTAEPGPDGGWRLRAEWTTEPVAEPVKETV